ncbi:helicase loader [Streptococcus chenjunshii]|uniref:Helicase loader n=1 Tax=Streptococcus chenjunshii TaxID=2173853 RepID=A0A372KLV7_9STRE|nr:DnaD domain protein [Streptococcus chenjunshii]AXQ78098.1 helicase loader [Streptococcus chenjunshii]RFU51193.1 helicase loader [Streptococcus chenjunshii]RFU53267.1 helicase loader [Streptococcus chenjunshii]
MKPIDDFYYITGNKIPYDSLNLIQLYFPIIGQDALSLYDYFIHFFDGGQKRHKLSEILNHLQFGMKRLEDAVSVLGAMELLELYQSKGIYYFRLKQPLSKDLFLAHPAYRRLLSAKIGDVAVQELNVQLPKDAHNISKKFSDVFDNLESASVSVQPKPAPHFDLENFQRLMQRDGLRFKDEKADVIALYNLAEKYELNWFALYGLAKETAIKKVISPQRMLVKKQQTAKVQQQKQQTETFSKEEQIVLREAKAAEAELFLSKIKKARRARITQDEKKLLEELAQMNFLDEVINVMVLYTLNKTKSANLNKSYLMKIANDFSYQKISTAEEAVLKMRSFAERQAAAKTKQVRSAKSNVPEWSNPDYKNETTAEELQELAEFKKRTLAQLRKDGE